MQYTHIIGFSAPKKGQKMSLNAFLEDTALGSWADEMDSLPNAPAPRTDEERARDMGRSDFSSRPDRAPPPPREDVPLPTAPPFTAFVGNLAFDMTESELEDFFAPHKTVSVKIIADRDGKPKGFGYVEFVELDGLKDALSKSGASLSHRTVRVNVAEPQRERGGFGGERGGGFDDEKFSGNWRREGPLPPSDPAPHDEGPRRGTRFHPSGDSERERERERPELGGDWRSSRAPPPAAPEREREGRRGFGVETSGAADVEETWSKGSKFRPSEAATGSVGRKFGAGFERGSSGPGSGTVTPVGEENDWRSRSRPTPSGRQGSYERSPSNSTPPTPQLVRKKLELLPRTGSAVPTPLSSPSPISAGASTSGSKANPFGAARPVDVSAREKEVEERLAKEREETAAAAPRHTMSRETSRQATARGDHPPHPLSRDSSRQASHRGPPAARKSSTPPASATVRPAFSFANAAKKAAGGAGGAAPAQSPGQSQSQVPIKDGIAVPTPGPEPADTVEEVAENVAEITV
ncbi:hypothetical protein BU17DRAFT_54978 [Hysterangium stoloniferum]|nr:hypothetical protein BU17DRAFT_54978 [Hysterangium stoloniferum]